ncbi:hypothetical protein BDF14DRAFT_1734290 [Spinellus fusiger]|nr:hypothetical protein BDF14DRAFT_1734290 [Spinellus fusiger]
MTTRPATVDPQQLNFLMPYKQFSDNLRNTHARSYFTEEELHSRYLSYKQTYATRQLTEFFKSNKDKIWFLEKYHPVHSLAHEQDTKKRRRHDYDVFMAGLERGEYDDVNYDGHPDQQEDRQKMEEGEGEGEEEYENKLVIKTVPPTIPREKIIEMCSKVDGFEYLALSEPNISKKFHRVGWIQFSAGTDMEQAHTHLDGQKIDDFVFHVAMNKKNQTVPRIPRFTFDISNSFSRLKKDFEQAQALARKLEESLGEKMHGLEAVLKRAKAVKERTGMKLDHTGEEEMEKRNLKKELDLVIAYLRHVHMYCYYCALECNSREELSRKCVEPHYRRIPIESNAKYSKNDKANYWLQNLDHRIELKLYTPKDGKLESLGGKVIENELSAFVKTQVHKEHEAKYKCKVGDCSKAFKGYDFVEKHIFSKHPEEVERIREDVTYYNNYVLDPNHVLPVMNPAPGQPPNLISMPAATGTQWKQIPRIGMDIDSLPRDPRQVKSYVDLDAPAEGDANISFY